MFAYHAKQPPRSDPSPRCDRGHISTPENRLKRPRDPAQLTKLMIDIASRKVENRQPPPSLEGKDAAASTLGRRVQVGLLICHNQSRAWENLRYCGVLEARERPRTD